jgi:hypothetical protein
MKAPSYRGGLFETPTRASAFGAHITQTSGGILIYLRYQAHADQSDIVALAEESALHSFRVIDGEGAQRLLQGEQPQSATAVARQSPLPPALSRPNATMGIRRSGHHVHHTVGVPVVLDQTGHANNQMRFRTLTASADTDANSALHLPDRWCACRHAGRADRSASPRPRHRPGGRSQ